MPAICFYFQVHQPYRIRPYTFFDIGSSHSYFDDGLNRAVMERVASRCYIPANRLLLELIRSYEGDFKVSFSMSGTAVEQMRVYAPEALESFRELAATGCVEFLAETYYHSLASLYDRQEFRTQVQKHREVMLTELGVAPTVFRNTELIYFDELARDIAKMGFGGVLVEGADSVLGWRSPNQVYRSHDKSLKLLVKNYRLSDDIAFRFTNQNHCGEALTAQKYADELHAHSDFTNVVGLFLDFETFGEHLLASTGIFDFLRQLPQAILSNGDWRFSTPSEIVSHTAPAAGLSYKHPTSWADTERDISAWAGNQMQRASLEQLYSLGKRFGLERESLADDELVSLWRKLQTSDHFYYMATKSGADGEVHAHFSPFDSPYRAFIAYRNILSDLMQRVNAQYR